MGRSQLFKGIRVDIVQSMNLSRWDCDKLCVLRDCSTALSLDKHKHWQKETPSLVQHSEVARLSK